MHVVVTTFGSDGDVNPLLAIAAALVRRGVDVTFVANPFYQSRVRATGSRFVAAGAHLDIFAVVAANPRYLKPGAGMIGIWNELVVPSIRATYPAVVDAVRETGANAVVSHVLSYGGSWAAVATGARNVVVTTTTSAWLSTHQPLVLANWRAPRMLQGALTAALRAVGTLVARRVLGRVAAQLGAPVQSNAVPPPDLNLGVWPEWFRPVAPDDPPRARLSGFVFAPAAPPLAAEVESFLAAGAPPVVVAFGSAASLHARDRYRAVAAACARLGRRCLLIGGSADVPAQRPDVLAVAAAPYARAFPAAAAVVHHGGFGTCAEALRAGKPSLVTPFAFDQFDTAARVQDARLARWFRGDAGDGEAVAAALDAVLHDASMAAGARRVAAAIAADGDGADRAAELIELVSKPRL